MAERQPDLGTVLRRESERHVPDRDAMLTRIAQRRTEPRGRWAFTALRPVAAAASVVAVLVAGFAGIRLADDRGTPAATETSTPAAPTTSPAQPSPSATAPSASAPHSEKTARPGKTQRTTAATFRPDMSFLSSNAVVDSHSNATWSQGNLTLHTTKEITTLDLVISVIRTDGVTDAGRWSTVPTEMITVRLIEEKDALLYRFTLNPGRTLAPGDYVFAAQYQHATGPRDPRADTYGAIATAGPDRAEITGAFTTN
ncbi:hypothetical protein AB0M02_09670 [Actinoplanes sp. NPDC051861]|uniref:hypothetical protein n=1 Tax=Actinoplanes sp. NPDC051861 TaxID=3155170 RepID=UPI00343A3D61